MDGIAAVVDDGTTVLLSQEEQIMAEEPFHRRPAEDIAAVAAKNGSATVEIQPYRDDPDAPQDPLVDSAKKPLLGKPTVHHLLVPFALFSVAFGGNIAPKINIALALVCREYFAVQDALNPAGMSSWGFNIAAAAGDIEERCQIVPVHQKGSSITMWVGLITGLLGAWVSPKLGAVSDRVGRRPVLMLSMAGPFLADLTIIAAARWSYLKSYNLFYLSAFFDGVTGSFIGVVAMCHSYATDTTKPGVERAQAFGMFHGILFTGMALGPSLSSFAIRKTGNVLTFFYLGLCMQAMFFFYVMFLLPESVPKSHQLQAQAAHKQLQRRQSHIQTGPLTWKSFLSRINVLQPVMAFYPTDGTRPAIRRNLTILGIMDFCAVSNSLCEMMVTLLYAEFTFHWTSVETGYYVTVIGLTRMFVLFLALPFTLRWVKARVDARHKARGTYISDAQRAGASETDIFVIRLSAIIGVIAYIGFLINKSPLFFLVCGCIGNLAGATAATTESTISKHVPRKNTGLILGAVGLVHSLARVISPTLYLQVYSKTLQVLPKTFFILFLAVFAAIVVLTFFIRTDLSGSLMEDGSDLVAEDEGSGASEEAGASGSGAAEVEV
ncbi:major facilitator superfamily domain-containing protein [Myxozyma melibiosi]|uniref:Major facilitator superfamily domain-containing protein n=1 Tax=Myxozyma melibiosi TaxID=54550 RepID=A0ABR1F5H0_9ASCO